MCEGHADTRRFHRGALRCCNTIPHGLTLLTGTVMRSLLNSLACFATAATALALSPAMANEATKAVVQAIEARDCVAAVRELNAALAGGTPEALALGGVMFEQGLCLKPNLERAARLYVKAVDAGAPSARSRLAGLYASPAGGPDKGAAIWWALQTELPLPRACLVEASIRGNAELFAQALGKWAPAVLDACVHVAGVLAALDAEFVVASGSGRDTNVAVDFKPVSGLDVRASQSAVALVDNSPRVAASSNAGNMFANNSVSQSATPEQMIALRKQEENQLLLGRVQAVAKDALVRFPRPAGIDPEWRIQLAISGPRAR